MTKPSLLIPFAAPQEKLSYLLQGPSAECAFGKSLTGLQRGDFEDVWVIIQAGDDQRFGIRGKISDALSVHGWGRQLEILALKQPTDSQAETIAVALEQLQITGPFWTKDPDNYFRCEPQDGNVVTAFPLDGLTQVNPQDKSYLSISDDDFIMNIAEKRIIGRYFCTGGYGFASANDFLSAYEELKDLGRLYLSHVIYQMMLSGEHFRPVYVNDYMDWGTEEEWNKFFPKTE